MMRFTSLERRSPILLITILFLLLIIISIQIEVDPKTTLLEKTIYRLSNPFVKSFFSTIHALSYLWNHYLYLIHAQKENDRLKREIEELKYKNLLLLKENRNFKRLEKMRLLDFPASGELLFGRIILRNLELLTQSAIINLGKEDGVMKDMNVIAPKGLVGRIDEVNKSDSRVIFITDSSSRVAVRVETDQGERYHAILSGSPDGCRLKYIPKDFSLKEGYHVFTSGLDSLYHEGLLVGEVKEIDGKKSNGKEKIGQKRDSSRDKRMKRFIVEPAVRLNLLNEVIIIKERVKQPETQLE